MKKLSRFQSGDTIVEVLIVIAIITLVLGGAFASARRSFITTQQTQERAEAIKYSEQQLERLRVAADLDNSPIFTANNFCMTTATTTTSVTPGTCRFGPGAAQRYEVAIQRVESPAGHHTFNLSVTWDRLGDDGRDTVETSYRVHPKL